MQTRREMLRWAIASGSGLMVPAIVRPRPKVFDVGRPMAIRPRYEALVFTGPMPPLHWFPTGTLLAVLGFNLPYGKPRMIEAGTGIGQATGISGYCRVYRDGREVDQMLFPDLVVYSGCHATIWIDGTRLKHGA